MPRYHFNLRYRARYVADEEGEEISGESEMRQRAIETARDLARTPTLAIPDWLECTLEVATDEGQIVLTLPFDEAIVGE